MQAFAALLDRLVLTPSRNGKIRLLVDYFRDAPDPDRGHALAAITGDLSIASVKPAMLRGLMLERMDEVLFGYSYDYVGDLAETIALVWPGRVEAGHELRLHEVVEALHAASRLEGPRLVEAWLDRLDSAGRYALLKLVTGELRVGVTARLAKQALARLGGKDVIEIEEIWHGLRAPYVELFAWLEGRAERPISAALAPFRPVMLAQALDEADFGKLEPSHYAADGIGRHSASRLQEGGVEALFAHGDDIPGAFPTSRLPRFRGVDRATVVRRRGAGRCPFGDLQQRLNRKPVVAKTDPQPPRLYPRLRPLQDGAETPRCLLLNDRRRLEAFVARLNTSRIDLPPDRAILQLGRPGALARRPAHRRRIP
jgi:DNA ligase-1